MADLGLQLSFGTDVELCDHFDTTLRWFTDAHFSDETITVEPATRWSDDEWFLDQDDRMLHQSKGAEPSATSIRLQSVLTTDI